MKKTFYLMLTLLLLGFASNAQVTIGSHTEPEKGALLQLTEPQGAVPTFDNAKKGLLFPRVSLTAHDLLAPLYGDAVLDGTNWVDPVTVTDVERSQATGMVVYNTNSAATGITAGLYVWDGEEWINISSKQKEAIFTPVSCINISIHGTYQQEKPMQVSNPLNLATDNYLEVTLLNVERPGTYTISVSTGNGYSFYLAGALLDKGPTTLRLPAQGTPNHAQTDQLTIEGLVTDGQCYIMNPVTPAPKEPVKIDQLLAENATGVYKRSATLSPNQNQIKILVKISGQDVSNATLTAAKQNGIQFFTDPAQWNGTMAVGDLVEIIMKVDVSSVLTAPDDFDYVLTLTIPDDGSGNPIIRTLKSRVKVSLPAMTYAVIGNNTVYTWNSSARLAALSSQKNFGTNGTFSIDHFTLKSGWKLTDATTMASKLQAELNKMGPPPGYAVNNADLPDVILYNSYGVNGDITALATQLARYVQAGGSLIFATSDNEISATRILLTGIYGTSIGSTANAIQQTPNTDNQTFKINTIANDPIVNGPFKTTSGTGLGGKYWAEDNSYSHVVKTLPGTAIPICSSVATNGGGTAGASIVWYDSSMNFFYFGDCVATGSPISGGGDYGSNDRYPSKYDAQGLPVNRSYGNPRVDQYNSALELNAVAWAIRQAAAHGINYK
jgi:hypothetical protein